MNLLQEPEYKCAYSTEVMHSRGKRRHQSVNMVKIFAFHPTVSIMLTALLKKQSAD